MTIDGIKHAFAPRVGAFLSDLHQHPEVSFAEHRTTRRIVEALLSLGLTIVELGLETGVVARLSTGRPGPIVGLRADIDAIMQAETADVSVRSLVPGVMHACGHDVHASSLLAAAMALADMKEQLAGDVIFIFQPAEEILEGARLLLHRGLIERTGISRLFGLHNSPALPVGTIGVREGALMAAKSDFTLTVRGCGGHGGMPEKCIDPIVASAGIISALQTVVSRNISPKESAVLSVCSIHGGTRENLIVDEVTMTGSIRALSENVRSTVLCRAETIVKSCAAGYGCTGTFVPEHKAFAVTNGAGMTRFARIAAARTVGNENVLLPASVLASEDFAEYQKLLPGFFYFVGSGIPNRENAPWHSAAFSAAPDTVFVAASLYVNSVLAVLDEKENGKPACAE